MATVPTDAGARTCDTLRSDVAAGRAAVLSDGPAGGYHNPHVLLVVYRDGAVWWAEDSRVPWEREAHRAEGIEAQRYLRQYAGHHPWDESVTVDPLAFFLDLAVA